MIFHALSQVREGEGVGGMERVRRSKTLSDSHALSPVREGERMGGMRRRGRVEEKERSEKWTRDTKVVEKRLENKLVRNQSKI